jgi:hypothetical protein
MHQPQQSVTAIIAAWACALCLVSAAAAEDIVVKLTQADVPLLRSPDIDGETIRTAAEGDEFVAVTSVDDFYLVKDVETGAFLYVHFTQAEVLLDAVPEDVLVSGQMQAPDEHDLSYWIVAVERNNMRRMKSRPRHGTLVASNGKEYPAKYDYQLDYRPKIDGYQLVEDAKKFLGTKYVLGGTDFDGIDCSGLTKVCLAAQGIDVQHRSSLQALEGRYIAHTDLATGDLIYFRDDTDPRYLSHVGIYLGGGKFIHASQSAGGVVITSLASKYFKSHYAFARRM